MRRIEFFSFLYMSISRDLQAGTLTGERQATNHGEGEIETERTTRSNLALQVLVTIFIHNKGILHSHCNKRIDENN
jgi:hypothetical protein